MFEYTVYIYTSPSGKHYVGQTNNEKRRRKEHITASKKGVINKFYNAIRKYGIENMKYNTLCMCKTREEVDKMEIYFIKKFNSLKDGYNMTEGGGGAKGVYVPKDFYTTYATTRYSFKTVCKTHGWNFEDFIEVFSKYREKRPQKLYFYYYKGDLPKDMEDIIRDSETKFKEIQSLFKISKSNFEKKYTSRSTFKRTCINNGWNFEDFEEIFSGHISTRVRQYYYIEKSKLTEQDLEYIQKCKENEALQLKEGLQRIHNTHSKPREYYATKGTRKDIFKKICGRQGWNFEDFKEVRCEEKQGKHVLYYYIFIDKH